jgi:hypothetical protein
VRAESGFFVSVSSERILKLSFLFMFSFFVIFLLFACLVCLSCVRVGDDKSCSVTHHITIKVNRVKLCFAFPGFAEKHNKQIGTNLPEISSYISRKTGLAGPFSLVAITEKR